jgi:hypothetical protein
MPGKTECRIIGTVLYFLCTISSAVAACLAESDKTPIHMFSSLHLIYGMCQSRVFQIEGKFFYCFVLGTILYFT